MRATRSDRLRRPGRASRCASCGSTRRSSTGSAAVSVHPGRRVPGHEPRAVRARQAAGRVARQRHGRRRRRPGDLPLPREPRSATSSGSGRPIPSAAERRARRQLPQPAADPRRGASADRRTTTPTGWRLARDSTSGCARARASRRPEPADGAIELHRLHNGIRRGRCDRRPDRRVRSIAAAGPPGARDPGPRQPRRRPVHPRAEHGAHSVALQRDGRAVPPARGPRPGLLPARRQRPGRLGEPLRPGDVRDLRPGPRRRDPRAEPGAARRRSPLAIALREAAEHPEESPFSLRALEVVQRLLASLDAHRAMSTERSLRRAALPLHHVDGLARAARARRRARPARSGSRTSGASSRSCGGRVASCATTACRSSSSSSTRSSRPATIRRPRTWSRPDEGDAVHVLTYHKAKGLEFDVVFLVGLVADRFPGRDRSRPARDA